MSTGGSKYGPSWVPGSRVTGCFSRTGNSSWPFWVWVSMTGSLSFLIGSGFVGAETPQLAAARLPRRHFDRWREFFRRPPGRAESPLGGTALPLALVGDSWRQHPE